MTVRAHFDGKVFVPDEPVDLPRGTAVTIAVSGGEDASALAELLHLADRHAITDSPSDWSEQHDHYIHGVPKQ